MANDLTAERASQERVIGAINEVLAPLLANYDLGYALIIFSRRGPGFSNFASNVKRPEMIRVLKELVMRIEAGDLLTDGDKPSAE